jgi:hypothetical protein
MSRTVLFAGGPLHGQTMTVENPAMGVYAMDNSALKPISMLSPLAELPQPVHYSVSRFAMCGRIIWIGHLGLQPDDDLVFEVLTSDGAKAAANIFTPAHP